MTNPTPNFADETVYRDYIISPGSFGPGDRFSFAHDDYDGAEDAFDHRCGYGATVEDCKAQIDEQTEGVHMVYGGYEIDGLESGTCMVSLDGEDVFVALDLAQARHWVDGENFLNAKREEE